MLRFISSETASTANVTEFEMKVDLSDVFAADKLLDEFDNDSEENHQFNLLRNDRINFNLALIC